MSETLKKGVLKKQIYMSYLGIAAIGLIIFALAVFVTTQLKDSSSQLASEDIPRTVSLLKIQVGLNRAIGSLRGWVALQDPAMRQENTRSWNEEILPVVTELQLMANKTSDATEKNRLSDLRKRVV